MIARKCDKCGKLYEDYGKNAKENGIAMMNINARTYEVQKLLDLCPSCMQQLKEFLGKQEEEDV